MRVRFLVVMCCVLAPAWLAASDTPKGTWKQVNVEDGVKVWQLEIPGRELPGFKGEAVIDASAERIADEIRKVEQHTQWMHRCAASEVVKRLEGDHVIIYNRTAPPWPVWDRDVLLDTNIEKSADGKLITLTFKNTDPTLRPVPEKVIRMPRLVGSYQLWKLGDNQTKVVYTVEVDVGGSLPTWIAERVARDMPYETLVRLRARVTGKK